MSQSSEKSLSQKSPKSSIILPGVKESQETDGILPIFTY